VLIPFAGIVIAAEINVLTLHVLMVLCVMVKLDVLVPIAHKLSVAYLNHSVLLIILVMLVRFIRDPLLIVKLSHADMKNAVALLALSVVLITEVVVLDKRRSTMLSVLMEFVLRIFVV
jgi:hypothetical protein